MGRTYADRIVGLERVRAGDLVAHEANWRQHPDSQVAALRGVLSEVGWSSALLAYRSNGALRLIDGHLRAGLDADEQVPVLVLDVDDAEAEKLLLSMDPLAAMAQADSEALRSLLERVETSDAGLAALLADLNAQAAPKQGRTDPDDVPEPRAGEPTAKLGDVWACGEHRVICGDAADPGAYAAMPDRIDLALTDPPYGVGVDYGPQTDDSEEFVRDVVIESVLPLIRARADRVLVTSGHRCLFMYPAPTWLLAWVHPAGNGLGPWGFTFTHPVLAYGPDPYLQAGLGSRPDTLVLPTSRKGEGSEHPTSKPIEVWAWLLERGSPFAGQTVLDPFLGSGTTLIAAEKLDRVCYGIELEPRFVDVSIARWEAFTGQTAQLA